MSLAMRAAAAALTLSLAAPMAAKAAAPTLAEAHASFASLKFEVYDALPLDGLAPNIRFVDDQQRWRALTSFGVYRAVTLTELGYQQEAAFSQTPMAFDRSLGGPLAGATTSSTIFQDQLLSADVSAQGYGLDVDSYAGLSSSREGLDRQMLYNMLLGPGTGVRLTADATVSVSVDTQAVAAPVGPSYHYAYAASRLLATFSEPTAAGQHDEDNARVQTVDLHRWLDGSGLLAQDGASQTLTLSFENLGNTELIGRVRFDAIVNAVTAVPEPGTVPLWAAGAALLGLVARGRKAQR